MTFSDTAEAANRAASAAMYGGATVSASSGASMYFGFSTGEWQVFGIVGGLLFAAAGFLVNWAYKHKHYKLARGRLEASDQD